MKEMSAVGTEISAHGTETSAVWMEMPTHCTEMPAIRTEMYAHGMEMPAVEMEMPAHGTEMCAHGTEMPGHLSYNIIRGKLFDFQCFINKLLKIVMKISKVSFGFIKNILSLLKLIPKRQHCSKVNLITIVKKISFIQVWLSKINLKSIVLHFKLKIIMQQMQINRLEMQKAVNTYLNSFASVWSTIPIITGYKTSLAEINAAIGTAARKQDASQVFISNSQRDLKKLIAEKMDILDDTLEAYAGDTGNVELLAKADNSTSDYFKLPNEDFEIKVSNVIVLLEENADQMTDYGFTVDQIEDVKTNFNDFLEKRGKPRAYKIASRVATSDLKELFSEAGDILGKLDKVLSRFKRSNTAFYNGYEAARLIVGK